MILQGEKEVLGNDFQDGHKATFSFQELIKHVLLLLISISRFERLKRAK